MGEGGAGAAAVQVDNASVLAAGEDDTPIEGVVALGVDKAGALQEIEGIALGEEVTPQASAGGITDLQLFDQGGVMQSALFQIPAVPPGSDQVAVDRKPKPGATRRWGLPEPFAVRGR